MPTTKLVYLDASATGANNGTSLADAYVSYADMITGEAGDLPALDRKLRVRQYGNISLAANLSFGSTDGWVTNYDNGHYIEIVAGPGYYATSDVNDSAAEIEFTNGGLVVTRDVVFEGIKIKAAKAAASQTLMSLGAGGTNRREFKNSHILYTGSGGSSNIGIFFTGSTSLYMQNCIVKDFPQVVIDNNRTANVSYIYKNHFIDNGGIVLDWAGASADLVKAKENVFKGNTTDAAGTFAAGTDRNSTTNASLGYTVTGGAPANDRVSQTFTFTSATDFRLASGDTGGKDLGTDLKSDSDYPVVVDITNTVRPNTPTDLGAVDDADTTPPVLSAYTETSITGSGATVGCTTNEIAGDLACVVTNSATQPTAQQILDGNDHNGATAAYSGSISLSSSGAKTFAATFGPAGVDYFAHFVHRDPGNNDSNIVSSPAAIRLIPTITAFGTGNVVTEGVQFTVVGDGFEAAQGSGTLELGDGTHTDAVSITSWGDESIVGTWTQPVLNACPFEDANHTISGTVTTHNGLTVSVNVSLIPASGRIAAPLSAADVNQDPGSILELATVANNDQVNVPLSYVSTESPFNTVNISWEYSNGNFTGRKSLDPGAGGSVVGSYTFELWHDVDGSVEISTVTVEVSGLSPDDGVLLSFEDPVALIPLMTIDDGVLDSYGDTVALSDLLTANDEYLDSYEDSVTLADVAGMTIIDHYLDSYEDQGQIVVSYWATNPPSTRIINLR